MTEVGRLQKIIWEHDVPRLHSGMPEGRAMGWDPRDKGVATNLIGLSENGAGDLMLGTWEMQPGEIHLLHHHPNATEAYYILEGIGRFTVDDDVISGGPGLALYFPRNTKHRIIAGGSGPLRLLYVFTSGDWEEIGCIWDE